MIDKFSLALLLATSTFAVTSWRSAWAADNEAPAVKIPPAAISQIDFVNDIRPIFQKACIRCHGPEKQKGSFRLDVREAALKGGESYAPNIIPRKSSESPLIRFVSGTGDLLMPPEGERLTEKEVGLLRAWIDQGAIWPD